MKAKPIGNQRLFTVTLAASLMMAAVNFAGSFALNSSGAEAWFSWWLLGEPIIWTILTGIAYRTYGKQWRWFLIGAPFALGPQLPLWFVLGICGGSILLYGHPAAGCGAF